MRIPAKRVRCDRTWDGKTEGEGFLILDVKGLDTDGVTTFVLSIEEVKAAMGRVGEASAARDRLRGLFGD